MELIGFGFSFNRRVISNSRVLDEIILSFINSAQTGTAVIYFPMSCRYRLNPVYKRTSYWYFCSLIPPLSTRLSSRLMGNIEKKKKSNTVYKVSKQTGIVISAALMICLLLLSDMISPSISPICTRNKLTTHLIEHSVFTIFPVFQ